jgi:hypothetical protein
LFENQDPTTTVPELPSATKVRVLPIECVFIETQFHFLLQEPDGSQRWEPELPDIAIQSAWTAPDI